MNRLLTELNRAFHVLVDPPDSNRPYPGTSYENSSTLSIFEKKHVAKLIRVNHVGEVCAQALYRGQALFCQELSLKRMLENAADEELDHLSWCRQRLKEVEGYTSSLSPVWYISSFTLGMLVSLSNTTWNLSFMAETERQVEKHLQEHLQILPAADLRSKELLQKMKDDEVAHYLHAEELGTINLPWPIRKAMQSMAKIMTTIAYRI